MTDIFDSSLDNINVDISDNHILKGEEINVTKLDPTLTNMLIGVGWDLNAFGTDNLDLDVSCFLLNKDGKTCQNEDFVFYNNLEGTNSAVMHNGDNLTGAGDGDDESLSIDLNALSFEITRVVFVLSIYNGEEKEQGLRHVKNAYIRVLNASNSHELVRYILDDDVKDKDETAMLVASLNREGPKWHFKALGEPVPGGLAKIAEDYDIVVQTG